MRIRWLPVVNHAVIGLLVVLMAREGGWLLVVASALNTVMYGAAHVAQQAGETAIALLREEAK